MFPSPLQEIGMCPGAIPLVLSTKRVVIAHGMPIPRVLDVDCVRVGVPIQHDKMSAVVGTGPSNADAKGPAGVNLLNQGRVGRRAGGPTRQVPRLRQGLIEVPRLIALRRAPVLTA